MSQTLRALAKSASLSATGTLGDRPFFLIDYALRLSRVAVLLSLWRTILSTREEPPGLTLGALLTYTLIAEVFSEQLVPRACLEEALWEGTIATRLLSPLGMFSGLAAEMVGRWIFHLGLFSLPLMLAAPLLGVDPRPASLGALLLFIPSLVLGVSVGLAIELIFGALIVALDVNLWVVQRVRGAIVGLLSGVVLPLAVLPWRLGDAFTWLPFAAMASAPLRVYTGTGDPLLLMLLQLGWVVVLWPFADWLWRSNREGLVGHGG